MPTATFFNLREDKQEIIVQAALLEFSQRSLPEALVSNIVKESDIARGSFFISILRIWKICIYTFIV